jgi:formylglycine-generating enzyme
VVTSAQFARFVTETAYVTEAEKFGWSFVFEGSASVPVARECDQNMGRVK